MSRTLIVARMEPGDADEVARLFGESDETELPHLIGVSRRTLFAYHGLYFHLVEAGDDLGRNLGAARDNPLYADLNDKLSKHIKPYLPTWREPRDAMAAPFYSWRADR